MSDVVVCRNCRRPVAVSHKKIGEEVEVSYAHGPSVPGVTCNFLDPIILDELSPDQVLICDFCCAAAPEWSYPCRDFHIPILNLPVKTVDYNLIGWWAACEQCKDLIDAEDWEGTARRYVINQGLEADSRIDAWFSLVELHQAFGQHRTGKAIENVKGAH